MRLTRFLKIFFLLCLSFLLESSNCAVEALFVATMVEAESFRQDRILKVVKTRDKHLVFLSCLFLSCFMLYNVRKETLQRALLVICLNRLNLALDSLLFSERSGDDTSVSIFFDFYHSLCVVYQSNLR